MIWVRFFVIAILVSLPITVWAGAKAYSCYGKYKGGGKPDEAALEIIIKNHAAWLEAGQVKGDKRRANLCEAVLIEGLLGEVDLTKANLHKATLKGAVLFKVNLSEADLSGAKLIGAMLDEVNLTEANLNGADLTKAELTNTDLTSANLARADLIEADLTKVDLSGANLFKADLTKAKLIDSDLSKTDLTEVNLEEATLLNTALSNAIFTKINLKRSRYEPRSAPDKSFLSGIQNLDTVRFIADQQSGLILLRNNLREAGLRELERKATYAIEKGITDHSSSLIDKFTRRLFFEKTAAYGLYPGKCLIILLSLIPLFSIAYFFSIYSRRESFEHNRNSIYKVWLDDRIRKDQGSDEPELITAGFLRSIGYAFYFSLLSAFHIGWRDINVGNWIARIQPLEYTLRSTGWVRTVSGIQSLISIYLLAFWVMTQFGRPFD